MIKIKFLTLNIRGMNETNKVQYLKDFLKQRRVDVCFLQETHIDSPDLVEELGNVFVDFFCYFTVNYDKTKGVGVLVKKELSDLKILNVQYDLDSRFISIELQLDRIYFNFINIYAPNVENEQLEYINKMYDVCASMKNIIIAGDFNAVSKAKDRIGSNVKKLKKYENEWNCFFKNFNLMECKYKNEIDVSERMTWTNGVVSSKIDKIFYSKNLLGNFEYDSIFETCKTDHKAVFSNFSLEINSLNQSKLCKYKPWRLNEKILGEKSVKDGIIEICQKITSLKQKHDKIWYDFFIKEIVIFLKKKGKEFNEISNKEKIILFQEVECLNSQKHLNKDEFKEKKNKLKEKIDVFYEQKRKALEKKIRDDRRKFSKQPTKSLIESISRRSNANEIRIFKKKDNELSTDKKEILNELHEFYQSLLGNEHANEELIKNYNFKIKKMDKIVSEKCPEIGMKITVGEVESIIKDMKDSSPGSNGLTIGFYKIFFKYFAEDFVEILNDSESILPEIFNENIIKLIMKNTNEIKSINDLRPITLTNLEYRIYTKILANRFRKVGPFLFLDYQTCSVNGRRINDSLNAINDVIYDANLRKKELYIVSIDQRKAFDSISHKYLYTLLDHLNISQFLTNSIKRIYDQSYASIVVDKYISKDKIYIRSGIKQGCASSMFLYSAGIEELAVIIHNNKNITGYKIPKMVVNNPTNNESDNLVNNQVNNEEDTQSKGEIKKALYADDTQGILVNLFSIDFFFEEFNEWGKVSGASMNEDKTQILAINSPKNNFRNIKFVDEVKILGIIFSKVGVDKKNLMIAKKKIENTLNMWNGIKFNLIDKITVVRTFGLSKLWYLLNFISLEENDIKEFETLIFKYIWNGKAELISRRVLYSTYERGGLNMVCIRAKICMILMRNLLYIKLNMNRPQYQFSLYWMKFYFRDYLKNFNAIPVGLEKDRPKYYGMMIEHFKKYSEKFAIWCVRENEKKKKSYDERLKRNKECRGFTPYNGKVLNNPGFSSKFIYNLCIEEYCEQKILPELEIKEQEIMFSKLHKKLNSSKMRLTNYKLIQNALPTNFKFKNRYDNKCYMCKKVLNEDLEHIFVKCDMVKKWFHYVKENFLENKETSNSLVLLKFKRRMVDEDYRTLSCFVYVVWRVRNECKHGDTRINSFEIFKRFFNKWLISLNNI